MLRSGKRQIFPYIDLTILSISESPVRCSIIVSTKIDKRATRRNRMKRLVSESIRHFLPYIHTADIVIRVKRPLPDAYTEVEHIVHQCLTASGIMT